MTSPTPVDYEDLIDEVQFVLSRCFPSDEAHELYQAAVAIPDLDERVLFIRDLLSDLEHVVRGVPEEALLTRDLYRFRPVGVREFVTSPRFLNKADEVYPIVLDELEEMNSGQYVEIVLTGGIGSAKTTCALYTNAYQLYLLSCLHDPHKLYGLDSASEIVLVFQSITQTLAKGVDYDRFRQMIQGSPYFSEFFPFDRNLTSKLVFPHRIEVKPVSGADTATIGQNVMGGLIDELNYMAIVERSKLSIDKGMYDQAVAVYNSISRRRKSRFMKQGKLPGILCLVSSKKYPGQFTDLKEQEAAREIAQTGRTSIYVYDRRVWEIVPEGRFSGQWFNLFIGDGSRRPRVLAEGEGWSKKDHALIMRIPEEYRSEFDRDLMNAMRDIAGVSTLALFPFFYSREQVAAMFDDYPSVLSELTTDFTDPPIKVLPSRFWRPELPRWIHIDLSVRKDSTGMSCACVPGFASISRGDGPEDYEVLPQFRFDFQLAIRPPKGGEILFYKIRSLIYALRDQGLNVKWVSLDSFQSSDMIQILRQNNFITGELSMDTSTLPYETLKSACYDGRVSAPLHPVCEAELVRLELDAKLKKIDHPTLGSKDVADSMAGCCHGLTMRRETWVSFEIPIVRTPTSFQELMVREKDRMKELGQSEIN